MSLPQIRDEHHVPAHVGQRVSIELVDGPVLGTITGARGDQILVRVDGYGTRSLPVHPTLGTTYLKG